MTHDPKHTPEQQDAVQDTPVNASRRKLTQASLAAPVVLGTLASRKVLAAPQYHCTISGQMSGNLSRPGGDSCKTGKNVEGWITSISEDEGNKLFNSIFADIYHVKDNQLVKPGTQGNPSPATLKQVLTLPAGSNDGHPEPDNLDLGRAAVASWLNAEAYAPDYPLTKQQVVDMFNATINGGTYQVNTTTFWYAADVLTYFQSLY